MKLSAKCFIAIALALIGNSCVSPRTAALLSYPPPNVYGPYEKSLSHADIVEISSLCFGHQGIRTHVYDIYVTAPDAADVDSGIGVSTMTRFKARKIDGHWQIVPGSVHDGEALFTS